jgi:hypothetical protein
MAKLPVYTANIGEAPTSGGRRASAPDNALGGLGRTVSKVGDSILTNLEDKESRTALIASSEIRAKYARALDEAALGGGDTDVLKEKMAEELSRVGEPFETARGASSLALYSANAELGFDEQSNRIKITRAAAEAELEGSKFLNAESELMRSNPGHLAVAEQNAAAFAATLRNIPPEKRALIEQGLKSELNMASAISAARMDPAKTKTRLEAGEWNLTPTQREQAIGKADSEMNARRAAESYARSVKEYEERETDDKARDKHFADIIGGTATQRGIMDDADLRPQTREHLINLLERRAKELRGEEKKSDPTVLRALWIDIHRPPEDPRRILNGDRILDAVARGDLNTTDGSKLNTLVREQKDSNNQKIGAKISAMSQVYARVVANDPRLGRFGAVQQAEIVNMYTGDVYDAIEEMRAKNDAVGLRELFSPSSKTFIGSAVFMKASIENAKMRMAPAAETPISTQAEYDALPPGTPYIDSKGNRGVKKGATVGTIK